MHLLNTCSRREHVPPVFYILSKAEYCILLSQLLSLLLHSVHFVYFIPITWSFSSSVAWCCLISPEARIISSLSLCIDRIQGILNPFSICLSLLLPPNPLSFSLSTSLLQSTVNVHVYHFHQIFISFITKSFSNTI